MRRRVGFIAFQLLVWHYSACINAASFLSSSGISPSPFKSCFHRRTHRAAFAVVSVFFKSFIWTDLGLSMRTRGWWKWKEGKKSLKKAKRAENKILGREIQYSPWFQFVIILQELMVQTFLGKDLGTKCSGQSSNCSRTKVPLHHLVRRVYSFDALKLSRLSFCVLFVEARERGQSLCSNQSSQWRFWTTRWGWIAGF